MDNYNILLVAVRVNLKFISNDQMSVLIND